MAHPHPPNPGADTPDAEVIVRSRRDPVAFAVIFHRHFAAIHGYAARRLGVDAADDVAAETFLAAFRKRGRFDPERGAVRPWLYGIATRLIGLHRRAESRRYRALARTPAEHFEDGHEDVIAARVTAGGVGADLADALARLPRGDRDEALWRKAGSPSSFRVRTDGGPITYTSRATPWRSDGPEAGIDPGGGGTFLGGPVEDLQKLPTDPARLAERFLRRRPAQKRMGIPEGGTPGLVAPGAQIKRVSQLLSHVPIPPEVRAGLMRTLAAQPDIHAIGRATDPLDREGVALASEDRAPTILRPDGTRKAKPGAYRSRQVIIFDERTGALLSRQHVLTKPGGVYADMKSGFIIDYSTVRSAKWTDTKPKPPAKLPF